jgi:hypothetical protein
MRSPSDSSGKTEYEFLTLPNAEGIHTTFSDVRKVGGKRGLLRFLDVAILNDGKSKAVYKNKQHRFMTKRTVATL